MGPSIRSNLSMITTVAALMASSNPARRWGVNRWSAGNQMGDGQHSKGVFIEPEKKMQTFFVKGEKIIAGSRKDAIKIYNRKFGTKKK